MASNPIRVTDPNNNVTVFVYDPLGNVTSETDPLQHTLSRSYDLAGRLQEETNRNGLRSTFQYDGAGRLVTETWYAADGVTVENTLSYTYDLAGHLLTASDNAGTYTFTYDGAGRVQTVQDVWGLTLTFSYDAEGNRTQVQDSLGGTQTSTFDAAHRLLSRILSGTGLPTLELDQAYDQAGRLTSQSRYHDATQGPSLVTGSSYSYDAAGHITDLEHTNASNGTIAAYQYTYDAASQLTSATENGTTKTYSYDDAGQLRCPVRGRRRRRPVGQRFCPSRRPGHGLLGGVPGIVRGLLWWVLPCTCGKSDGSSPHSFTPHAAWSCKVVDG